MKLWLLAPIESERDRRDWHFPDNTDPWVPWYNKAFGFVVRAATEQEAREFAASQAGAESARSFGQVWTDPRWSTCHELTGEGEAGVVLRDFMDA